MNASLLWLQSLAQQRLMSAAPIRTLAVDDHSLLRCGIAVLVATQSDMTLVAEASTGREAIQLFRILKPDICRVTRW